MEIFKDQDEPCFQWLAQHPSGFVVNTTRSPSPKYLMLHKSGCLHIQRWEGRQLTAQYIKACSDKKGELVEWARTRVGGELTPCRSCSPEGG